MKNLDILDINQHEQGILRVLIQRGSCSATQLSSLLNIKRPTIYIYLESLKQKGLITENVNQSKKTFKPVGNSKINEIIDQKIQALRQLKKEIPQIVEQERIRNTEKVSKGITLYKGENAIKTLADEIARFNGPVYFFGSMIETKNLLDDDYYEKIYSKQRRKKMNIDYLLSSWNSVTVKYFHKESGTFNKRRFLPENIRPNGCFGFFKDKLIIFYYQPHITAIVIQDKSMVEMMKLAYLALWPTLEGKNIPPKPSDN